MCYYICSYYYLKNLKGLGKVDTMTLGDFKTIVSGKIDIK